MSSILNAILSGAVTGGGISAASSALKARKLSDILIPALQGALVSGSLAGGSTALGEHLLGEPDDNDLGGHTNRGALGGALGGGTVGGALGAVAGAMPFKAKRATAAGLDSAGQLLKAGEEGSPWALRAFKSMAKSGPKGALIGGALGALGLGGAAAYLGADEGMQLDYIKALKNSAEEDERRERMLQQQGMNSGLY